MGSHTSRARRVLKELGWLPCVLAGVQFVLLLLTDAPQGARNAVYGCSALCDTNQRGLVPNIVTAFGLCVFIVPMLIGIACQAWSAAVALAVLPWWLAVILHARTLLTPYIGLGQTSGRFDDPFWISPEHLAPILMSFALFTGLGALGWLIARSWQMKDRAADERD